MKKHLSISLAFAVALCAGATAASAQQASVDVNTANAYGMAGCGLGSMIFGSDPGFVQVFAGTTNSSFGSQTFGITSGTSNCTSSEDPLVSARSFVETNRQALARDMARGQGETINALAELAGCPDSAVVGKTLQRNFGQVFSSASADDKAVSASVVRILQTDSQLSCQKLATAS